MKLIATEEFISNPSSQNSNAENRCTNNIGNVSNSFNSIDSITSSQFTIDKTLSRKPPGDFALTKFIIARYCNWPWLEINFKNHDIPLHLSGLFIKKNTQKCESGEIRPTG